MDHKNDFHTGSVVTQVNKVNWTSVGRRPSRKERGRGVRRLREEEVDGVKTEEAGDRVEADDDLWPEKSKLQMRGSGLTQPLV